MLLIRCGARWPGSSLCPSRRGLAAVCALLSLSVAPDAAACSAADPETYVVDPTLADEDASAPGTVQDVSVSVSRGKGPESSGCGSSMTESMTSCDDMGTWRLTFPPPVDDESGRDLGYVVELVEGRAPGLQSRPGDVLTGSEPMGPSFDSTEDEVELMFHWTDGSNDDQEPVVFTVRVRAVDRAGNLSEPSETIAVQHAGDSGCSIGGSGGSMAWLMILSAGGVLAARRSRGRPRLARNP